MMNNPYAVKIKPVVKKVPVHPVRYAANVYQVNSKIETPAKLVVYA